MWMLFASADVATRGRAPRLSAAITSTKHDQHIAGAENSSAMKNAYATGLGLWDGLVGADATTLGRRASRRPWSMAKLSTSAAGASRALRAGGGRRSDVEAAAGRNRAFGERVGKGKPAKTVAAEMLATEELTEGDPAIASAWRGRGTRRLGIAVLGRAPRNRLGGREVAPTLARLELTT